MKLEHTCTTMNSWRFDDFAQIPGRQNHISGSLILLAFLVLSHAAWCQQHYKVDPSASEIRFELGATGHAVEGTFHVTSGGFTLEPRAGAMTGMVTVDAASGQSDSKYRDKKMTADQLKAQTFPTITFAPTKFSGRVKESGDSTGQVDGTFTLIGQSHPVSVALTVHREGSRFTATGNFQIPYVSWGIKNPSIMFLKVAKEVKIDLKLAGNVTK